MFLDGSPLTYFPLSSDCLEHASCYRLENCLVVHLTPDSLFPWLQIQGWNWPAVWALQGFFFQHTQNGQLADREEILAEFDRNMYRVIIHECTFELNAALFTNLLREVYLYEMYYESCHRFTELLTQHFQQRFLFLTWNELHGESMQRLCESIKQKLLYRNSCHLFIWMSLYLHGSWQCAPGQVVWARWVLLRWGRWRRCRWEAGQLQGRSHCSAGSPCYRGLSGSTHTHAHTEKKQEIL